MFLHHIQTKVVYLLFGHNLCNCRLIFKINSATNSQGNSQCNHDKDFHLTLTKLLQYNVSLKIQKAVFQKRPLIFSSFLPQISITCNKNFSKCASANILLKQLGKYLQKIYMFFVNRNVIVYVTAYLSKKSGRHVIDQFWVLTHSIDQLITYTHTSFQNSL